ncbi:hypothetical protein ES703_87581 [subsurface metagenome]
MTRYTQKDIETLCKGVNEELAATGPYRLRIGYRYNYQAIDLLEVKNYEETGGIQRTLIAGLTKNEIWQWLHAFLEGIYYSHNKKYPTVAAREKVKK